MNQSLLRLHIRPMNLHYVLVDYENVPVKSLALLQGEQFRVCVFLGKNNTRLDTELVMAMQKLGDRAQYVKLTTTGPNALDFHIAYYLGKLVSADATGHFHVISKDKGFDSLIERLRGQQVKASRVDSIEAMACFPQGAAPATPPMAPPSTPQDPPPKLVPTVPKAKPAVAAVGQSELEARVEIALTDLQSRRSARPAKKKTLVNTIHARIGKELPASAAEAVFEALVKKKHVVVNGLKVSYNLPKVKVTT